MNVVNLVRISRIRYGQAMQLQNHLIRQVKQSRSCQDPKNYLVVLEHDPVYTVGIRNRSGYAPEAAKLKETGAEYFETNRGGLITFHGPGQLVAYPVLDLRRFFDNDPELGCRPKREKQIRVMGMRWYVNKLEQTVMDTLKIHYGLESHRSPDTGVWMGSGDSERKICAIGIHSSDLVTSHGIGLNCSTDLSWFDHIVPCGIEGKGVTSLSIEKNIPLDVNDVLPNLLARFQDNFRCQIVDDDHEDLKDFLSENVQ